MASLNRVFLIGNLTRDPELRYTPSGSAVANIGLAVNEKYKDGSGDWKDKANFFTIVAWGRQAEVANEYLSKGSPVLIEGKLQQRSWENQQGEKRSVIEVVATNIQFLNKANSGRQDDDPGFDSSGDDDYPF